MKERIDSLAAHGGPGPLYARVLVLKSSHSSLALVALDLGRTFDAMHMADLRARFKSDFGIEHVIFSASHTHNGPTPDQAARAVGNQAIP